MYINNSTNLFTVVQIKQLISLFNINYTNKINCLHVFDNKPNFKAYMSKNEDNRKYLNSYLNKFSGGLYLGGETNEIFIFINNLKDIKLDFSQIDEEYINPQYYYKQLKCILFVLQLSHEFRHNYQKYKSMIVEYKKTTNMTSNYYNERYRSLPIEIDAYDYSAEFMRSNYSELSRIFKLDLGFDSVSQFIHILLRLND